MKTEDVKIEQELNETLWARGNRKPMPKVKVIVKREDGKSTVQLFGSKFSEKAEKKEKKK
jgi:ribosomal protein L31E